MIEKDMQNIQKLRKKSKKLWEYFLTKLRLMRDQKKDRKSVV